MRTSFTWLAPLSVVVAVFAGCSSSSGGHGFTSTDAGSHDTGTSGDASESDGGGVSAMQACADYAKASCTQANSCTPFTVSVNFGDEATCEQRQARGCMSLFGLHGSSLTPAALDACAQAVMAETCVQFLDNHQPSACNFMGTLADGSACGSGSQCQNGYCKLAAGSTCGTCATRTSKCASDSDCPSDQLCAAGGMCVTPVSPPGMCDNATHICERTLVCLGEQGNDAGLGGCGKPGGVGAACQDAEDCAGGTGILCDTAKMMCVQAETATAGQPCGIVSGALVVCTAGAACTNLMKVNDAGPPVVGTCHPPAADGAPCGTGVNCTLPAVCDPKSFTCKLPDPSSCM